MREILFRGKTFDNEWIYGFLILDRAEHNQPRIDYLGEYSTGTFYCCQAPRVHRSSVGQFTTLTDKNGKKIFEGDIVKTDKFNTLNKLYVIKYDLLLGAFIGEDDGTMCFTTFDGDSDHFEVIGNIYDNPELLKEQQNER